jgi:hypothetical protein
MVQFASVMRFGSKHLFGEYDVKKTVELGATLLQMKEQVGREVVPLSLQELAQIMVQFGNLDDLFDSARQVGAQVNLAPNVFMKMTKDLKIILSAACVALTKEYQAQNKSTVVELDVSPMNYPVQLDIMPQGVSETCFN